jgi:limonene 1,2-monooxygenase
MQIAGKYGIGVLSIASHSTEGILALPTQWGFAEEAAAAHGADATAAGAAVIGTPDDLVGAIRHIHELTGGFGAVIGFAHDWANREATMRSWDLVARYVFPAFDGSITRLHDSQQYVHDNQADLMAGATRAVMAKVMAHEGAAAAMGVTMKRIAAGTAFGGARPTDSSEASTDTAAG